MQVLFFPIFIRLIVVVVFVAESNNFPEQELSQLSSWMLIYLPALTTPPWLSISPELELRTVVLLIKWLLVIVGPAFKHFVDALLFWSATSKWKDVEENKTDCSLFIQFMAKCGILLK